MLTEKQNEIIEQIKQEFESHNRSVDLRKKSSSFLNLQTIISDIQERDDYIEEQYAINLANYKVVEQQVQEEIKVLNDELKVLGFYAELHTHFDPKGGSCSWDVRLSKINAESSQHKNFMALHIEIKRTQYVFFKEKRIDNLCQILAQYDWRYSNYRASNFVALLKNDYVRDHLSYYWEKFNIK